MDIRTLRKRRKKVHGNTIKDKQKKKGNKNTKKKKGKRLMETIRQGRKNGQKNTNVST